MSQLRSAVSELIITAVAARSDLEEVYACSQAVLEELPTADEQDGLPSLRRLAEAVGLAPLGSAGVLALTGAAIVEVGTPPGILLAPVLERLEEALQAALPFVDACRKAAGNAVAPDAAVEQHGEAIARTQPQRALAWNALEPLGLAVLVLLKDPACCERAGERAAFRARLLPLREAHPRVAEVLAGLDPDRLG